MRAEHRPKRRYELLHLLQRIYHLPRLAPVRLVRRPLAVIAEAHFQEGQWIGDAVLANSVGVEVGLVLGLHELEVDRINAPKGLEVAVDLVILIRQLHIVLLAPVPPEKTAKYN